jgi:hypothetical protein
MPNCRFRRGSHRDVEVRECLVVRQPHCRLAVTKRRGERVDYDEEAQPDITVHENYLS